MTTNHQSITNHSILPIMLHQQMYPPITTQKIFYHNEDIQMSSLVHGKMSPMSMKMSALAMPMK